jgi:PadR family transcriptional regulator PadR
MYSKVGGLVVDRSQLMKGTLEGCILKIISTEETYGYEIVNKLQSYGFTEVREGTIYPLLVRLENKKIVRSCFKESPLGPKRKYYALTPMGSDLLVDFIHVWRDVKNAVDNIILEA